MKRAVLIFFRNIKNNLGLFLINISSFSVGLVAVLFISLYVIKEFKTDRFHKNYKNIYRVLENRINAPTKMSQHPYPLGNLFIDNHVEIQDYTRYLDNSLYTVKINNTKFSGQKITYVDKSFFSMFDFALDIGNYNQIFKSPNTIIVDHDIANRYFNTTDVLGKTIEVEIPGLEDKKILTIVGLLSEYPEESTLKPKIIADIKSSEKEYINDYFSSSVQLFLFIPNCTNISEFSKQLANTYYSKLNELRTTQKYEIDSERMYLQKLASIYLHSAYIEDDFKKGDYTFLWVLICIGIILLTVTFLNYTILNIGLGIKNQKQSQIHQIIGGGTGWLKKKFVSESVFFIIVTFFSVLLLLPVTYKLIINFTDYHYSLYSKSDLWILFFSFPVLVLIGIVSGFFQYWIMKHRPIKELGLVKTVGKSTSFKYLVSFQLVVFISIISAQFIITKQIKYIRNQDFGYDLNNTITVTLREYNDMDLFIQEFEQKTSVDNISVGHTLFNETPYLGGVTVENSHTRIDCQCIWGDHNYVQTYKLDLLSGENISKKEISTVFDYLINDEDIIDVLVNEEFVRKSGLKNPLGTFLTIDHNGKTRGRITGIIKDVKNLPLYYPITPMVIGNGLSYGPSIIVSVQKERMEDFKNDIAKYFEKIGKESYFGYNTYSYDFDRWYKKEQTLMLMLRMFSVITLFILILGLVGLSLFIAESKTKEIGIRKVNGAKVFEILSMLNRDFVKWVVIAFAIATPIAYYAMNKWLENFAYKTSLSWWIFALAGLLALGIALLTVSWQSWRAATRNPVEALRYE